MIDSDDAIILLAAGMRKSLKNAREAAFYFTGVWQNVTAEERLLMTVLAEQPADGWSVAGLAQQAGLSTQESEPILDRLRGHDVIPTAPSDLRIASELLRRWIVETKPAV